MNARDLAFKIRRKFQRSLSRRGIVGTLWFFTYRSLLLLVGHRPANQFDKRHGTDTTAEVKLDHLNVHGANVKFGIPYTGTPVDVFERFFRSAPIPYESFTFVDFGSGKGLAVLLASNYPFRKIVGVEFAAELIEVAQTNLFKYRNPTQKCTDIEFICTDVTEYRLAAEPTVFYFCNPFVKDVMKTTVARIEQSLRKFPREAWIVYVNPVEHHMFDGNPLLCRLEYNANIAVYHALPHSRAHSESLEVVSYTA
jgi:hypothetical protein